MLIVSRIKFYSEWYGVARLVPRLTTTPFFRPKEARRFSWPKNWSMFLSFTYEYMTQSWHHSRPIEKLDSLAFPLLRLPSMVSSIAHNSFSWIHSLEEQCWSRKNKRMKTRGGLLRNCISVTIDSIFANFGSFMILLLVLLLPLALVL